MSANAEVTAMSESHPPAAGPISWPELIADRVPLYREGIETFIDLPEHLATSKPPRYAGGRLGGFHSHVSGLAVMCGPDEAANALAPVESSLSHVIAEIGSTIDRYAPRAAFFTLNTLNAARCIGASVPPEAVNAEQRWLPQMKPWADEAGEPEQHTLALAACAASLPALVPGFASLPALPARFVPAETQGFNVPAFAGYIAAAITQGGSYQDVEPAWLDFVHRFPFKLNTEMLSWPALMWAARAVYATIGELPENEVALELHRLVTGA
jgi:hypothetical protein